VGSKEGEAVSQLRIADCRLRTGGVSAGLRCVVVALLLIVAPLNAGEATPPFERGLDLVRNELLVAKTGIRALSVAAHPDDEDGGTLSYLRRTLGVETHMCLSTRGEGGQNESGPELGNKLAALRTQETEAAAEILGAKVWYLNLPDFGFSKSPDEALSVWGHDHALSQMVRVIRIVRPHILFTNHDPEGKDHGHHVATARLAVEAFDAAADPNKFPDVMKEDGTQPWQIQKMYLRRWAPPGATLSFDVSARDPLTGLSASEIAALALSKHVTQGMSRDLKIGEKDMRHFTLLKSKLAKNENEKSLVDGLIEGEDPVRDSVGTVIGKIGLQSLEDGSLARSIEDLYVSNSKPTLRWREAKRHVNAALAEALGVRLVAHADDTIVTPGETAGITIRVANTGKQNLSVLISLNAESAAWDVTQKSEQQDLNAGSTLEFHANAMAQPEAFPTFPADAFIFNRIQSRTALHASLGVRWGNNPPDADGQTSMVYAPVNLDLAPPREVSISPNPVLIFDDPARVDDIPLPGVFRLVVTNHRRLTEPLNLFAGINQPDVATADKPAVFVFKHEEETWAKEFRWATPLAVLEKGDVKVQTAVWTAEKNFGGPVATIRRVPLKLPPKLVVGLVKTYDESTHQALKRMEDVGLGLTVQLLSPDDLRTADLNHIHTIILDLRATQYRPDVLQVKERLMQFMKDGGNIVCMYHKDFDWNEANSDQSLRGKGIFRGTNGGGEIAPYPIELSFDRVTDEKAPVRILAPQHPLLSSPCKIWERDFEGWVQERGVYFPKKWAKEYTPLLSSNDPDGKPLDGGLLVADVGEGSFIYTSYVWYRQLRIGNAGAFRMLANMISYPRVKRGK
jgi:LmbE family N-acetylglucosaminyl deacetylase